jgi:hypothetical protein
MRSLLHYSRRELTPSRQQKNFRLLLFHPRLEEQRHPRQS